MATVKFRGVILAPGSAEGQAIHIEAVRSGRLAGVARIVVSDFVTPLDSIYLKDAKGIIVERGGILSHVAIYSRELGIPCVRLENARSRIPPGSRVQISGDGVVTVEY